MRVAIVLLLSVGCSVAPSPTVEPLFFASGWSYPLHFELEVSTPLTIFDINEGERPAPELRGFMGEGLKFAQRTLTFTRLKQIAEADALAFTVTRPELRFGSTGQPRVVLAISAFVPGKPRAEVTIPSEIHHLGGGTVTELRNLLALEKVDGKWQVAGWEL